MDPGSAAGRAGAAPAPLGAWRPFPSSCCCCFSSLLDVNSWLLFYGFLYLALYAQVSQSKSCDKISCFSGHCVNSTCVCDQGWVGDQCQHCQGRFNGLIVPEVRGNETVPEVVTTSGYALLHFFSDAAYNLTGFNIFYSINSCPNNCSEHGKCTTSMSIPSRVYCECDKYWKGEACDIPYCKANCGSPDHGYCDLTGEKLCVCNDSWQGFLLAKDQFSEDIYMYGGKIEANNGNVTDELWIFNIHSQTWSSRTPAVLVHGQQYAVEGHSAHIVELDSRDVVMLIIFGYSAIYGYTSIVQEYYIRSNSWLVPETKGAIVQGGYGHTSVYDELTKSVYVHGGYKALPGNKYGLVDDLYRYEVNTRTWTILKESGFARYLHSAVLINGAILVFGGNTHNDTSLSNGAKCFSADFLAYDIACDEWKILPKPNLHRDVNRFGHTAVVSNGSMYIFGGFSSVLLNDILVYKPPNCEAFRDEELCKNARPGIRCLWNKKHCESWESGHANNILRAKCPKKTAAADDRCYRYADCASCTANTNGCQWCDDKKCISANSNCSMSVKNYTKCHVRNEQICNKLTSCKSCSLHLNCQWDQRQQECQALPAHLCGEGWSHIGDACLRINSSRESYDNAKLYCYNLSGNLASLTTSKEVEFVLDEIQKYTLQKISPWVGLRKINISYWGWDDMSPFTNTTLQWLPGEPNDSGFCAYLERAEVAGLKANPCTAMADGLVCEKPVVSPNQNARPCKKPCSLRTTCSNCTSNACQCNGHSTCINSNVCDQCKNLTTGKQCETCMPGYYGDPTNGGQCTGELYFENVSGPKAYIQGLQVMCWLAHAVDMQTFATCKQENVSAQLRESKETSVNYAMWRTQAKSQTCLRPATDQKDHSFSPDSVKVACVNLHLLRISYSDGQNVRCAISVVRTSKSEISSVCIDYITKEKIDLDSLLIDYQFTFSLLQEDDRHHTAINFIANPEQSNKNLDISINASNNFNLNITWSIGSTAGTISGEEIPVVSKANIKEYRDSFSCEKFNFRSNPNITFYVYVSNFSWPIKIQIAFSQHNTIMDLVQFFVTFFRTKTIMRNITAMLLTQNCCERSILTDIRAGKRSVHGNDPKKKLSGCLSMD
ncbi:hypothetical protein Q9233_006211 [Columba guinea]|nr:hypothetical protein Q9233_006211 [Columba guinea]